jgi:hypothetical protein
MKESLSLIMNTQQVVALATWILGGLLILVLVAWTQWTFRKHTLQVRPGEVAVMVDATSGAFVRFQPAGQYLKLPALYAIKGTIPTGVQSLEGHSQVVTRDGYTLSLYWIMHYRLTPGSIEPSLQAAMADILLSHPTRIAALQTNHCLGKIIGQQPVEILRQQGVHAKINPHSTRSAVNCLAAYGIQVVTLRVEAVHWPETHKQLTRALLTPSLDEQGSSQHISPRTASRTQPTPTALPGLGSGTLEPYTRIV